MENKLRDDFLVFGAPDIREEEIAEVVTSLRSGWIGTGPKVAQFEAAFADYKGVPPGYTAAVNSCTAALHVSLIASSVGPGDEVITTPLTFCATVNAIIHAGATPILADVDPVTMNIDPDAVESRITPRTRAMVPVHFAGRPCEMKRLMEIARRNELKVIEDCAHAIEAEYHAQPAGTFGDFGCFSFYVTKNLVTGEGGMVLARRPHDIGKIRVLSLHGLTKDAWHRFADKGYSHYYVVECGFKYNMMDLQAAIGLHQLERIHLNWTKRERVWRRYNEAFADLPIGLPAEPDPDTRHAYHLYTIQVDEERCGISRDAFIATMTGHRIGVGVHYVSLPEHPYYQENFHWRPEDFPVAMEVGRRTVSLPLSPRLSDSDVEDVVVAVRYALARR